MARGKKKHRGKYKLENLTTKAMCCINSSYCNTINDLVILEALRDEIIRLYSIRTISPFIASDIICNIDRRTGQIRADKISRI